MQLVMVHDLSTPSFGTPATALYAAALDMCAWADDVGFDTVALGEHHGALDGYDPSPIVAAAAIAARTARVAIRTSVLLSPLYDPVKLAEDLAVTSIFSQGRLIAGLGAGYRPSEFEAFGKRMEDRWEDMAEVVAFLRKAWTGEPFEWRDRTVCITPRPEPPPPIILGGGFARSARRAAHIADGWLPRTPDLWGPYRDECKKLGRPDPGPYSNQGPVFLHVALDPERAWDEIAPHARRMAEVYGSWQAESAAQADGPYAKATERLDIRASPAYQVLGPEEALELAIRLGAHGTLYMTPLLSGLDPSLAWSSLRLFEERVLPHLPRPDSPAQGS